MCITESATISNFPKLLKTLHRFAPLTDLPLYRKKKEKKEKNWSSHCGSAVMNLTSSHEDVGSIPGLPQWVRDPVLL